MLTLAIGILSVAFGVFTLVLRVVAPETGPFSKLDAMKDMMGTTLGTAIHVFAYSVVPLLVGSGLILGWWVGALK